MPIKTGETVREPLQSARRLCRERVGGRRSMRCWKRGLLRVSVASASIVLTTLARGDDGPPPLSKPLVTPAPVPHDAGALAPATPPDKATAKPPVAARPPESAKPPVAAPPARPFLVVPAPGRTRAPRSVIEAAPETRSHGDVQLTRPLELEEAPAFDALPPPVLSNEALAPRAGVVGRLDGNSRVTRPSSVPHVANSPSVRDPRPRVDAAPITAAPKGESPRPFRMFRGLFASPPPINPAHRNPAADNEVKVEPRIDPAADAALKRRIERQIDARIGDRVGKVEVRVVGRNVVIRAHATRFWQRRSVRHDIEAMPSLAGYHARVDIID